MWCFQWCDSQWSLVTQISEQDRGLAYGDGLFETFRINCDGKIPLFNFHSDRMQLGLDRLLFDASSKAQAMAALGVMEEMLQTSCWDHLSLSVDARLQMKKVATKVPLIGKFTITRGVARRGYDIPSQSNPTILVQFSTAPDWQSWLKVTAGRVRQGVNLQCANIRLAHQSYLAGLKHCNRLEQILARQQKGNADDVVMLDADDNIIESGLANICLKKNNTWFTPRLSHCGVAGVIRQWLINSGRLLEMEIPYADLAAYDAVMICNSVLGILAVQSIDQYQFDISKDCNQWQAELESLYC